MSTVAALKIRELMPLGAGGMGTAYLGCTKVGQFERLVVVKRLHEHLVHDPDARQRLIEEAELAAYVHHANVVGVQHIGKDDRGLFVVLDFVDGTSLNQLILARSPLCIPEPLVLRIVLDCLAGLSAIHTTSDNRRRPLNILHRDVTPDNILVGLDGVSRLSDFGIAKSSRSAVKTAPLQLIGKLPYMAPEYIDRGQVGPQMDVYALGITLWQLLVGRLPWDAQEQAQFLVKILIDGVPPIPEEAKISRKLQAIVAKACALDPNDRYPSARAMATALEALHGDLRIAEHAHVADFVLEEAGPEAEFRREEASARLERPSMGPRSNPYRAPVIIDPNPPVSPLSLRTSSAELNALFARTSRPSYDGTLITQESAVVLEPKLTVPEPPTRRRLFSWIALAIACGFLITLGFHLFSSPTPLGPIAGADSDRPATVTKLPGSPPQLEPIANSLGIGARDSYRAHNSPAGPAEKADQK